MNYEGLIIFKPQTDEEEIENILEETEKVINGYGELQNIDRIGKKELEYEIQGYKEAYHVKIYFKTWFIEKQLIADLEMKFRNNENTIQFIPIRK